MNLIERKDLTQATLDRFLGSPLEWGSCDCALVSAIHAEAAGHETPMAKARNYRTEKGALRAIKSLGFNDLEEMTDATLTRIPYARAMIGDVIAYPAADGWKALGIHLGNGRALAFADLGRGPVCAIGPTSEIIAAWSID